MGFSYFDENRQIKTLDIQVGKTWDNIQQDTPYLNTIFDYIDNRDGVGDGVVQIEEISILLRLLKLADKLVNKENEDNVLSEQEAERLIEQLKNGTTSDEDINAMKIPEDIEFWSIDNLKKMYPESQYKYEITQLDNETNVTIYDKTCKEVLRANLGSWCNDISFADSTVPYKETQLEYCNGKYNRKYENQLNTNKYVQTIIKDLSPESNIGFSDRDKFLMEHILDITPENIELIMLEFADVTEGKELYETIKNSKTISDTTKTKILSHLEDCIKKSCGYVENLKKTNDRISNPYYKSKNTYSVSWSEQKVLITNASNPKETFTLDLNKLFKDYPVLQKYQVFGALQKLPAEVLIDISKDVDHFVLDTEIGEASYDPLTDTLNGYGNTSSEILCHEIGHSVDYTFFKKLKVDGYDYENTNYSSTYINSEIMDIYNKELAAYQNAGHKLYTEENGSGDEEFFNYVTYNITEMFAESYTLIMTGENQCKDCILAYFPETFEAIKKHLENIRNMPDDIRRNTNNINTEYYL